MLRCAYTATSCAARCRRSGDGAVSDLEIAEREHEQVSALIAAAARSVREASWHRARPGRRWTPAEELPRARAAAGTMQMQMQMQRSAFVSALSRAVLIPLLLRSGGFPSGGVSPHELDPLRHRQFAATAAQRTRHHAALLRAY